VHAAELIGILYAVNIMNEIALTASAITVTGTRVKSAIILSDSMSALRAIQYPGNKSGQQVIHAILRTATSTKTHGIAVGLQWIPAHYNEPGNEAADQLAKEAATPGKTHPFPPCYRPRGPTSVGQSTPCGKGNGKSLGTATTFATHYRLNTQDGSMDP
jgi:hypothetical protein